eukprot:TRINITY_DN112443_c0_g1_i1.p1 TRINITY_DN112443_c0_g1~~TRINITY_DN112443_c0_g1_i1.p1  ORF type:complete len:347 (-),score=84.67 TRINITY_DN112443_c0_g1_i1:66-1106(-)
MTAADQETGLQEAEGPSEDAAAQLEKAMATKEVGTEHYKAKRFQEAKASWLQAMREMPKGENAQGLARLELSLHLNLAQVYLQLGTASDLVEAAAHSSEVLKIEPENSKALYRRGLAHGGQGKNQAAAQDLQRAARIEPRNAEIRKKYEEYKQKVLNAEEEADREEPPPVHDLPSLPKAFIDVSIGGAAADRLVFALYSDVVPKTAENFRQLCTGEHEGKTARGKPFHFKGCLLHRLIPGLMIQGGDFENANGTGGESIYGRRFPDEGFRDKPCRRGLLGMANDGPNTNGSNFFVLLQPAEHLEKRHVLFGEVVEGMQVLDKLEALPQNPEWRPIPDVVIVDCGTL